MNEFIEPTNVGADRSPPPAAASDVLVEDPLVDEDLLVEEISIDGMCGVY
jgi:mycofactocin precursor